MFDNKVTSLAEILKVCRINTADIRILY